VFHFHRSQPWLRQLRWTRDLFALAQRLQVRVLIAAVWQSAKSLTECGQAVRTRHRAGKLMARQRERQRLEVGTNAPVATTCRCGSWTLTASKLGENRTAMTKAL
jgi:hypothetical protein